jgi:peroxidase
MNLATSFLDLSLAYGNSRSEQSELRMFKNGLLKAGGDRYGRETLPPTAHGTQDQCSSNRAGHCYKAGDNRANQHPALTALHTVSQRRHNQHAQALQRINPHWSDERLFQEARRINIAEFQHITFEEYLPLVFGPTLSAYYTLQSPARSYRGYYGPAYTTYEPHTDPTTWNDYSAAACRYGHSQINGFFSLIHSYAYAGKTHGYTNQTVNHGGYWLRDSFFDPHLMHNGHVRHKFQAHSPSITFNPFCV